MAFTVASAGPPGKATLVSPTGTITTATPTYTWNAVATATYYQLYVNDSTTNSGKIVAWYTAADAGCGSGTGNCSVTPSTALAAGAAQWWVQTWNPAGAGPWSDPLSFAVVFNAGCPQPNGLFINHSTDITANEIWAGDGTVHKVSFDITIRPGATLTLAACAVVQVASGRGFRVWGSSIAPAKFVSAGTADKPVLITKIPGGGNWGCLWNYTADSSADLSYTTLENGGNGTYQGASLDFSGGVDPSTVVVPMVRADHLVVKNSLGTGIAMQYGASFTANSTDITVTGGGSVPGSSYPASAVQITQLAVATLPTLHVSGNAFDQILVVGNRYISRDVTLKNLGVPYYFYWEAVRVSDPAGFFTPTLTVEPGVELRFDNCLQIGDVSTGNPDRPGRLLALGTTAQPILFTSPKPTKAAGDWMGVWLKSAAGSRIENARIEFAGGWNGIGSANCKPIGSNDQAGLFIGWARAGYIPSPSDFVNVTIADSASHGINAMWTAPTFGTNLTGSFTFQNIMGCKQTKNGIINYGCQHQEGCLVP